MAAEISPLFQIKLETDLKTYRLVPAQVESLINANTIAVYASAPSFPHGTVDPIEELGRLCMRYDIGLHVDNCLGALRGLYMS